MKKISVILCLLLFQYGYAQNAGPTQAKGVGINTTNPTEALHVIGKIRVTDTDPGGRTMASVIGVDNDGVLGKIDVGKGLVVIKTNTIIAAGSGYYDLIDFPIVTVQNIPFDNLDLGLAGNYSYKTVIRFTGVTSHFDITGITAAFAGKHIILLNQSPKRMRLIDDSDDSIIENRIFTYNNNPAVLLQGWGSIELVYDGHQWIVLNVRG